jgi:hypothetical protein
MLSVANKLIVLSVIMLNVVMLSVVVPFKGRSNDTQHERQHSVSNDVVPSVPFYFKFC